MIAGFLDVNCFLFACLYCIALSLYKINIALEPRSNNTLLVRSQMTKVTIFQRVDNATPLPCPQKRSPCIRPGFLAYRTEPDRTA